MPYRLLAASELAEFIRAIGHPRRIQIIEELRSGDKDVASLQLALGITHSGVSQHLMVLRAHRIVTERREGRRVFYRLFAPQLAQWLVEGMRFLPVAQELGHVKRALLRAKATWNHAKKPNQNRR